MESRGTTIQPNKATQRLNREPSNLISRPGAEQGEHQVKMGGQMESRGTTIQPNKATQRLNRGPSSLINASLTKVSKTVWFVKTRRS